MKIRNYLSGMLFVLCLTAIAVFLQGMSVSKHLGLSAIIISILIGMLVKNVIGVHNSMHLGINFCSKKVLRLAIILLGFKLSLLDISKIGYSALIVILISTTLTLILARVIGKKLGISRNLSILIGAGTSICGASAIVAVNAVSKSENEEETSFAVAVVTILGTIFMFLYPFCFHLFTISTDAYALWTGASIHEVAQVVAAGFAISPTIGSSATIVKLTRVLMVIPVTIILSIRESRRKQSSEQPSLSAITIPWFVLLFLLVVCINSLKILPIEISSQLVILDNYLMAAAMVALGLETSILAIKQTGLKPLYLGIILSFFISVVSLLIIEIFV